MLSWPTPSIVTSAPADLTRGPGAPLATVTFFVRCRAVPPPASAARHECRGEVVVSTTRRERASAFHRLHRADQTTRQRESPECLPVEDVLFNLRADEIAHRPRVGVRRVPGRSQSHRPFVCRQRAIRQRVHKLRLRLLQLRVLGTPGPCVPDEPCRLITVLGAMGHVSRNTGSAASVARVIAISRSQSSARLLAIGRDRSARPPHPTRPPVGLPFPRRKQPNPPPSRGDQPVSALPQGDVGTPQRTVTRQSGGSLSARFMSP